MATDFISPDENRFPDGHRGPGNPYEAEHVQDNAKVSPAELELETFKFSELEPGTTFGLESGDGGFLTKMDKKHRLHNGERFNAISTMDGKLKNIPEDVSCILYMNIQFEQTDPEPIELSEGSISTISNPTLPFPPTEETPLIDADRVKEIFKGQGAGTDAGETTA